MAGETAYLDADIRDTAKVLEAAAQTLDFSQPVGLMMIAVLHCVTDEDAPWSVARELVSALPSGSYLALTHPGRRRQPRRAVERRRPQALTGSFSVLSAAGGAGQPIG